MVTTYTDIPTWQVYTDFPFELQFAGSVGQKVANLSSRHKDLWWAWYLQLLVQSTGLDAPSFSDLVPALRPICSEEWIGFEKEWFAEQRMQYVERMNQQLRLLNISGIVQSHRLTEPFTMYINFVVWPDGLKNIQSATELFLGINYLESKNLPQLRTVIEEQLTKLA